MRLQLVGHSYKYAIEQIMLSMFPGERPVYSDAGSGAASAGQGGAAAAEAIVGKADTKFAMVGIQDKFGRSGDPESLFHEYGLDAENIAAQCRRLVAEK